MNGGNRVIAIDPGGLEPAGDEFLLTEEVVAVAPAPEVWVYEESPEDLLPSANHGIAAPLTAALAGLGWTAAFVWSKVASLTSAPSLAMVVGWIGEWSVPLALIGVVWLLVMRNSRREAARFGDASRLLADESSRLETRLTAINGELSLAREFIAAQSRDLESLGRVASERLSQSAEQLQSLILANSAQIESIGSVSEAALDNMEKLRGQLPVIANSARDVTNNIGNAGRTAHAQLQEMINGFKRLNEFGQASERQVETLREQVGATLDDLNAQTSQMEETAERRLAGIGEQSVEFRKQLDRFETDAIAALRIRSAALVEEIEVSRSKLDTQELTSLAALGERMQGLRAECEAVSGKLASDESAALAAFGESLRRIDGEIAARQQRQQDSAQHLTGHGEAIGVQMDTLERRIAEIAEQAKDAEARLGTSVEGLAERLVAGRAALEGADGDVASLTEATERLIELIQTGSQHSRETIPAALSEAETILEGIENKFQALLGAANDVAGMGRHFDKHIAASQATLAATSGELEKFNEQFGAQTGVHGEGLEQLRASLEAIEGQSERLATRAQSELAAAIEQLTQSADGAVAGIAEQLGVQSKSAIEKAVAFSTSELAGQIEQKAERAAEVSRAAAIQMRDQLAKVDELAGNLERRVAHARERAEEQVDNDFARRVAIITEALNSNAIDIAKAIDTEVSDTAWSSYLKGDRGIFARRAVSLIQSGEAKSIVQVYEGDRDFREQVNRYIHDFEAMLRQILSTRDGHALGVTLLSSDMGKLYVALAQAIERLRT